MDRIVLAGAAQPGMKHRQGLFRLADGDPAWRRVSRGLPAEPEIRALGFVGEKAYAGTQAGPYVSEDGGTSWRSLNLPSEDRTTWSVMARPGDPDTLYAGTTGTSIYRSTNAGARWERLRPPVPEGHCDMGFATRVIRMTADPSAPDEIYAGLEVGGVLRSLDGGDTWESCNEDLLRLAGEEHLKSAIGSDMDSEGMMDSHSLAVSPALPGTVFLATRMGLFRSDDRGETWRELGIGNYSPLTYARDVTVSRHDPKVLFGAFSKAATSDAGSLWRSADLGESWERFDRGVDVNSTLMIVAESASDPDHVWCAARGGRTFGTANGGASWAQIELPDETGGVYAMAAA